MSLAGRWIPLPALLIYGCADPTANRADVVTKTEYVERQVPVGLPCSERVTRHLESLLQQQTADKPQPEGKVEAVTRSDSENREYIARLEAAARKCGVTIE